MGTAAVWHFQTAESLVRFHLINIFLGPYMCRSLSPMAGCARRRGEKRPPRPLGCLPGGARLWQCVVPCPIASEGGTRSPVQVAFGAAGGRVLRVREVLPAGLGTEERQLWSHGGQDSGRCRPGSDASSGARLVAGRAVQLRGRWGLGLGVGEESLGSPPTPRLREETCAVSVPPLQRRAQMPPRICKWTQNAKMVKAHGEAHIPPGAFCGLEPAGLSGGGDPRGGGPCTEGPRPPTVLFAGAFQTTVFPTVDCMEAGVREGGGVRNKAFGAGILECGARRGVPAAGELMPPGQWRYRSHEECQAARHSLHASQPGT